MNEREQLEKQADQMGIIGLGRIVAVYQQRIEDALLHYQIGRDASVLVTPTFVDWRYVAECMAKALRGEEETQPVAPRDYTHEPEDDDGDPETTARLWDGH